MLPSRVVLGVAADSHPAAPRRRRSQTPPALSANQTTVFDSETIRGRFGYAADNVLFYATGGLAWSNAQFVRTQLTGALNSATAGTDEAVNKGLLGWRAAAASPMPSHRIGTSSPNIGTQASERRTASVVATDDNNDNDCECR